MRGVKSSLRLFEFVVADPSPMSHDPDLAAIVGRGMRRPQDCVKAAITAAMTTAAMSWSGQ
jgi:hypothetical protein